MKKLLFIFVVVSFMFCSLQIVPVMAGSSYTSSTSTGWADPITAPINLGIGIYKWLKSQRITPPTDETLRKHYNEAQMYNLGIKKIGEIREAYRINKKYVVYHYTAFYTATGDEESALLIAMTKNGKDLMGIHYNEPKYLAIFKQFQQMDSQQKLKFLVDTFSRLSNHQINFGKIEYKSDKHAALMQ